MFIIKKEKNGESYYYLRRSERINGKVIAKDLAYLGKNKKEAEEKAKEFEALAEKNEEKIEKTENTQKIKNSGMKDKGMIEVKKENKEVKELTIDELANFCKREGFIFRSSDIYGGFSGFWDFGPLGAELFNNLKRDWWHFFIQNRNNMVGIEASIISHPRTWKASGHIANFSDVAVECKKCGFTTKIDKSEVGKVECEKCHGDYEVKGEFSLMFKTRVGALDAVDAYLRGETAQGMFLDFKLVQQTSRKQLPFGIGQIGRCFRNEIAPRDFLFRSREFNIAEFEFFINPEEKKCSLLEKKHLDLKIRLLDAETQERESDSLKETTIGEMLKKGKLEEWHAYWLAEQIMWYHGLGLKKIKIREHRKDELSHYSSATFDVDYEYPFGSKELGGIANRGQYDLSQHAKESGEKFEIFDEKYKNKIIPKVIEPTFGMERAFLAILTNAYYFDEKRQNVILKLPAKLAPVKASVFPLVKDEKYEKIAEEIVADLRKEFNIAYDASGSIGRRYARNDEIGTPMCITIDEDTPKDKSVTVRDRDTTKQVRVRISELKEVMRKVIDGEDLLKLGKLVETRVKEE